MNELALFAGAGGGILAGKLLGWRTVCAVERDAYAAQVLAQRQNDGILAPFPIWSDVQSFDGKPWRGIIDVISGGFPCQDISCAGSGGGITGERSGLWKEFKRIICDVRPQFVFVENSPMLTSRGLGTVLADLAEIGFDAQWQVLSAADVGAPHLRERIWIVAHTDRKRCVEEGGFQPPQESRISCTSEAKKLADTSSVRWQSRRQNNSQYDWAKFGSSGEDHELSNALRSGLSIAMPESIGTNRINSWRASAAGSWWAVEPNLGRVANGVAHRVDRIKALGNGQVPAVAASAFADSIKHKNDTV